MATWWSDASVYQVYLRSFQDSNGDGSGDLLGLRQRLPYLLDRETGLGVDTLWLSPIHPSPDRDWGYDVMDYRAIHPALGTLADFEGLVTDVRAQKGRVLLDLVVNHTSDQHPWFVSSRSGPDAPHRDWYLWRERPNGWASVVGGSAWEQVASAHYLHTFLKEQPDLNWRNPAVRQEILDTMRFWLDKGVAGFRLDVFNCFVKDGALRDNPIRWDPRGLLYRPLGQWHQHDRDHPELADVLGEMRALSDRYDAVLLGETLDEAGAYDHAARWAGPDRLHATFHFGLLRARWSAPALARAIEATLHAFGDTPVAWAIGNHDFPRVAARWGSKRAEAALFLLFGLGGVPVLYQGDELGLPQVAVSRRERRDRVGDRYWPVWKGRDGARTPMAWSTATHGGFTTGTPWLPLHDDWRSQNVEVAHGRDDSVLATARRLIQLRRRYFAGRRPTNVVAERGRLQWDIGPCSVLVVVSGRHAIPEGAKVIARTGGRTDSDALGPDEAVVVERDPPSGLLR